MELVRDTMIGSAMDRPLVRRGSARPIWAGAALLVAAALGGLWFETGSVERSLRIDAAKLTISSVATGPFQDFIPMRGQVVPLDGIVLDAVQGGRVEQVLAEAGQRVTAGQALIRLSDPALELDAIARETQVIEQMNSQRSLQLNFELTQTSDARTVADTEYNVVRLSRQFARRMPLASKGFVAQETLDQTVDELAYEKRLNGIARGALARDAAVIKRSNELIEETAVRLDANLTAAKNQLDALTVRAPADGVLTGLDAHIGEEKTRGQHLGQIDLDGGFKVKIQVDEFYLARVKPGQRVTAVVDGGPRSLVVVKIYPQVTGGKFDVDLAWDGPAPLGLRRGQAVQGKLQLGEETPTLLLPVGPFLEASGGAWVFVVDRDGASAVRRRVKLGRRTTETVEVLGGLSPGDRVVTSDYTGLDRIDRLNFPPG